MLSLFAKGSHFCRLLFSLHYLSYNFRRYALVTELL